jgi:hypothetical protein
VIHPLATGLDYVRDHTSIPAVANCAVARNAARDGKLAPLETTPGHTATTQRPAFPAVNRSNEPHRDRAHPPAFFGPPAGLLVAVGARG